MQKGYSVSQRDEAARLLDPAAEINNVEQACQYKRDR